LAGLFISFHRCFLPSPFLTLAPPHPRRAPFDINDCPHDFSSDRPRPYLTAMTTAMPPVSCTGFFFLLISLLFFPTGYTLQHDWLGHFKRFEQGSRATFHGDWSSLVRGLSRIFLPALSYMVLCHKHRPIDNNNDDGGAPTRARACKCPFASGWPPRPQVHKCLCLSRCSDRTHTVLLAATSQARACTRLPDLAGAIWPCAWLLPSTSAVHRLSPPQLKWACK
jgi:hypothetical protein